MKTKHTLLAITLLGAAASMSVAHAAGPTTGAAGSFVYLGIKGGVISNDAPGTDNALNIGVYGGYNLLGDGARTPKNLGGGTLSLEGDFTVTAIKGDAGIYGDWNIMTLAGYAAYRFPLQNNFYLKGKAGARWIDIDTDVPVSWSGTDTGGTFGIGGGMKLANGTLEAELTIVENDITFLSIGYFFK
jgi:hypothetical protein